MMFGAWGEPDHPTCIKTIHAALDAGINFIDTADVYSQGESEIIVGKALADGKRDDVVLATKVHAQMGVPVDSPVGAKGDPNQRGNSRRWIIREVENSLRRLNTDWIDLYQVHRPIRTPISRRRCPRSQICSGRARSGLSARRLSPPIRWCRRSGSASGVASVGL
jgi:aryl-alcohol dehydrogenase-like predicted oxidoreductase